MEPILHLPWSHDHNAAQNHDIYHNLYLACSLSIVLFSLTYSLFMTGSNSNGPHSRRRAKCGRCIVKFDNTLLGKYLWRHLQAYALGIYTSIKRIEFDYTPWLGPNYKDTISVNKAPTIVSNHVSCHDITILCSTITPSFVAMSQLINAPVYGTSMRALQGLFIDRSGTQEEKDRVFEAIKQR